MSEIIYRPARRTDDPALAEIIRKTWEYDRFCTGKTAQRMARTYLFSCLTNQDFTCVAERDGEAVGVIMGKNEARHHVKLGLRLRQLASVLALMLGKEGRRTARMYGGIEKVYKMLSEESGRKFEGELSFFAVREDQRGTGIGKELFRRLEDYMRSEGIKNFYLYTDTSCNYGFYEHQGMKCAVEKKYAPIQGMKKDMEFYLYTMG